MQESFGTTRAKVNTKLERVLPSKSDLVTIFPTLIRSSLIGTLIGAIPGTGGDIAAIICWQQTKNFSKNSDELVRALSTAWPLPPAPITRSSAAL